MFDNIGKKIKTLTKVVCWIGMISTLALGIVLVAVDDDNVAFGIPIMVGGPLLCWLGSFLMYGFGELVDRTMSIEEMMRGGKGSAGSSYSGNSAASMRRQDELKRLLNLGLITEAEYNEKMSEQR